MSTLLEQIKSRRQSLGLKQSDMPLRIGVSRQQYQKLETQGNPRLDTLKLIGKGLNSELLLIPNEKLTAVLAVIDATDATNDTYPQGRYSPGAVYQAEQKKLLSDDPWQGLLEGER